MHGQPKRRVRTVDFALGGYGRGADGGPHFRPGAAVSCFLTVEDADALDRATTFPDDGEIAMPLDARACGPLRRITKR